MKQIKIKCPAKINLTLEILKKREDGFHDIQSIMQTIDLFDILTIKLEESNNTEINLSGTSKDIPYNEKNLVYKAAKLFTETIDKNFKIDIHIEKNIPIAAGLAGGSTDAAGTFLGLNTLLENTLSDEKIDKLCASLGSDLNFCLKGGCKLTTGRGEVLAPCDFQEFSLSLIKPKELGISAKEAYTKFSELENKPNLNMTTKALNDMKNIKNYLHNDLEIALLRDYKELQAIKNAYPASIMSGSGSTYFILEKDIEQKLDDSFWIKTNLKSINYGCITSTEA
ncbi:MAG: 4-(cytidine 5'-diphospho)-2-C-methyl-D-erythritol kinase [bacterium]|nr:4-(cytidine 5'-diphospho)-2-C-methyl-D-erythritol kinase [bacterium]